MSHPARFCTVSHMAELPPPDPRDAARVVVLRPVVAMSRWLGRMYIAVGALALLTAVALANRARVADGVEIDTSGSPDGAPSALIDESLRNPDVFVAMTSAALVLAAVAVFVLLVVWSWRMDRNMRALGEAPRLPGPVAIGGWFVPVANLVLPFVFVRDFVRGLVASAARRGVVVRAADYGVAVVWWFGQFAILVLSGNVDGDRTLANLGDFASADRSTALGFAIFAVSAACGSVTFARFSRDSFDSL